jgi:hypothetical protein
MNHAHVSPRISRTLVVFALAISALAFANWGVDRGVATAAGAALSVANWFALRWLGGRLFAGEGPQRALLSLLVVAKIGLLMAMVFVLVNTLKLDAIGLCLGLSVLFLGPAIGGLLAGPTPSGPALNSAESPPAATAAHEER